KEPAASSNEIIIDIENTKDRLVKNRKRLAESEIDDTDLPGMKRILGKVKKRKFNPQQEPKEDDNEGFIRHFIEQSRYVPMEKGLSSISGLEKIKKYLRLQFL